MTEAIQWLQRAANQRHEGAQLLLGEILITGHGVDKDIERGLHWLRSSAQQNHAPAALRIGQGHLSGEFGTLDAEAGFAWVVKAAKQNFAHAQYQLGELYYYGRGTERNLIEAYVWFRLASLSDSFRNDAVTSMKIIEKLISPTDLSIANREFERQKKELK